MVRLLSAVFLLFAATQATACDNLLYKGDRYTVCDADPVGENLRLFLNGPDGAPYGSFRPIEDELAESGQALRWAMNAGMFHPDYSPVGHLILDGVEEKGVITGASSGNFGLLPNGVFCVRPDRSDVFETMAYLETKPDCTFATQSGPMLVIDGELHPRFLPNGTSINIRNGVGTSADGRRVVFAISNTPVTFHEFGSFFRDFLNVENALYFDGRVSRLYAPGLQREDAGFQLGPIVGVVVNTGPVSD